MNILELYGELNATYFAGTLPPPLDGIPAPLDGIPAELRSDIDAGIYIHRYENEGAWDADQDEHMIGLCRGAGNTFTITISGQDTPTLRGVRSVLLHDMIHLADGLRNGQLQHRHDGPFVIECRRICHEQGWDWTCYEGAPATFPVLEKV